LLIDSTDLTALRKSLHCLHTIKQLLFHNLFSPQTFNLKPEDGGHVVKYCLCVQTGYNFIGFVLFIFNEAKYIKIC